MTGLPTPYMLQVRRRNVGGPDSHGNVTVTYGDPEAWPVAGIYPGGMDEPDRDRDLSVIVWSVLAPKTELVPSEYDRVILPGGLEYEVEGHPQDYTMTPWPPHPTAGVVVDLRDAEG